MPTLKGVKVPLQQPGKSVVVLVITCVAGFVDACCWIVLFHVYVANLTGNLVSLAIGGFSHDPMRALRGGLAVGEFIAGAIVSRLALRVAERKGVASAASVPMGLEVLLLGLFMAVSPHGVGQPGDAGFFLRAALPAMAMGVQNVTLRHVGPLSFYTTHVTGTVTRMAESLSDALTWDRDAHDRRQDLLKAGFMAGLLGFFAVGALLGVGLEHLKGLDALAAPALVLLVLIGVDQVRPLLKADRRVPDREHEELHPTEGGPNTPQLPV